MKKTVLAFLILAVTALIVGGSGALYYYHQVENASDTIQGSYSVRHSDSLKEVHLTLSGRENYTIETTDDNTIMFKTKDSVSSITKGTLKAEEAKQKVTVDVQATSKIKKSTGIVFDLGVVNNFFTSNVITIPKSVESLVIETADDVRSVTINSAKIEKIAMDVQKTDVDLTNISANQLTVKTTTGMISDNGSKVKQAVFTSAEGSIYLDNFDYDVAKTATDNGGLHFTNGNGTIAGTTIAGNIFVENLTGKGTFSSSKGDFSLETPALPKQLDVTLEQGNIEINSFEIFHNIDIQGDSRRGSVTLLSKERNSYKAGSGTNRFNLKTNDGNIEVSAPSDEEE